MMGTRVKAGAEETLARAGLARLIRVRPGGTLPLQPTGAAPWLLAPPLSLPPSVGIAAEVLGRAVLCAGFDGDISEDGTILGIRSSGDLAVHFG